MNGVRVQRHARRAAAVRLALRGLGLLVVWLATAVPRAAAQPAPGLDSDAVTELSRTTVLFLYERWADVLRRSGTEIEVTATNFRTVFPAEFPDTLLRDVVTVVPERRLLVGKAVVSDPEQHVLGVSYQPEWRTIEPDQVAPELATWNPTIRQVLDEEGQVNLLSNQDLRAATTFEVSLEALGQTVTYRALLLWHRLPSDHDSGAYHLNDPVAQKVEEAAEERDRVSPLNKLENEMREHLRSESNRLEDEWGIQDNPECVVDSQDYDYPQASTRDEYEHSFGYHNSSAIFGFTCNCNSRCTSTSQPSFRYRACLDHGSLYRVLRFHETHGTDHFTSGLVVDGHEHGAPAAGTSACFVESCSYIGGCDGGNIQFSTAEGGRIQANFTGQAIWDGQLDFVGECGRCTALQPEQLSRGREGRGPFNLTAEPPGGSGGGGGGSACFMPCSPVTYNTPALCNPYPTPCTFEHCDLICDI